MGTANQVLKSGARGYSDVAEPIAAKRPKTVGGLAGVNAGDSRIATVGLGSGLNYRGYNIEDLAANATFEEVFYLLIYERLP